MQVGVQNTVAQVDAAGAADGITYSGLPMYGGGQAGGGGQVFNVTVLVNMQSELICLRELVSAMKAKLNSAVAERPSLDAAALSHQLAELNSMIDSAPTPQQPITPGSVPVDLYASSAIAVGCTRTPTTREGTRRTHPPTHKCRKCGKTGTCARTLDRSLAVRMATHRCSDGVKRFSREGDLMTGLARQFDENCAATIKAGTAKGPAP